MTIKSEFIIINGRSIHVRVYNPDGKKTVVCWHGLARNGFDFEILAGRLAENYRVICPDTIGRGLSQWAKDPIMEYNYPNYLAIAMGVCEYFNVNEMDWIGTSMGGLIGIFLASGPYKDKICRLIINDIGPEVPSDALARIIEYTSGTQPLFDTFFEFQDYLKELYGTWGERTSDQWNRMTEISFRRNHIGKFTVHFDPNIIQVPDETPDETEMSDKKLPLDETLPTDILWQSFNAIVCPILLYHGLKSDVLTHDIVKRMKLSMPDMKVISFKDCGHAPGLHINKQIEPVIKFLSE